MTTDFWTRDKIAGLCRETYGNDPAFVVRAPGRVNLIGEHTDYNDGFVLPMALPHSLWMAVIPRADTTCTLMACDMNNSGSFDLAEIKHTGQDWLEYVKGVTALLLEKGARPKGFEGVMASDVPTGAGLSSSAALELATARLICALSDFPYDPTQMALLSQQAENNWVGVGCGIMDQLISACGKAGHALLIDCRDLSQKPVPLPDHVSVVVMDTATRRKLEHSAYNERRSACEAVARHFGVKALRDITLTDLLARKSELDAVTFERAHHVISENERTLKAAAVLEKGDALSFGDLMNQSHESLKTDYQVSCDELDTLTGIARNTEGCLGARMTGAGFGGCAVALVAKEKAQDFSGTVFDQYKNQTGLTPALYICQAENGAALV